MFVLKTINSINQNITKIKIFILIPNNFIILRDIKKDKTFLYNFLICIMPSLLNAKKEYKKNNGKGNDNLTQQDIEEIEIPVPKAEVLKKLSEVSNRINRRQALYSDLINNDKELINTLYRKEGVVKND